MAPRHITFSAHGRSVVTSLLLSDDGIISASDDHSIHVYSHAGQLLHSLDEHEGGVWAIAATKGTLVSGSTDRTVRVWDLSTGRCTHVFRGHTSTVRAVAIVQPEEVKVDVDGVSLQEKWPKQPLIVSGSRDGSLRVWALPQPGSDEYRENGTSESNAITEDVANNPFHRYHLQGHKHGVRALAAQGRTAVSGSYDGTVRVWDVVTGECTQVLEGHTDKVCAVAFDVHRNMACSGSMDHHVRVWDVNTGQCKHVLAGHTSLVGLLQLSPSYLISGSADATVRIWDPDSGEHRHTLADQLGAITCMDHHESTVVSGSDGNLKMWNIRDGKLSCDLLTGRVGVWQVVFDGRWCVAATNQTSATCIEVWDFGET